MLFNRRWTDDPAHARTPALRSLRHESQGIAITRFNSIILVEGNNNSILNYGYRDGHGCCSPAGWVRRSGREAGGRLRRPMAENTVLWEVDERCIRRGSPVTEG